jgi:hypothetical protein
MLEGDPNPPEKTRPRTTLLKEDLPKSYRIYEGATGRPNTRRHHSVAPFVARNGVNRCGVVPLVIAAPLAKVQVEAL